MTEAGIKWGTGRVADLEAGRVSPTLPTLLVLAQAFSDLLGRPVRVKADLLAGHGQVIVTGDLVADLADVRGALSGPVKLAKPSPVSDEQVREHVIEMLPGMLTALSSQPAGRTAQLWRIWRDCGLTEERTARALGVDLGRLTDAMADLWGHTVSEERDRRAGPGASPQKRGQITRQLRDELRKVLGDGDDQ
ncbi:hypothetical protein [Mycobacterium sp. 852002-51613_SCH5001154]|uniref:hypothetical protein n=1 Tax=Mycobacterium sp. 852002-51613_SCH5001154 TaxID=1834104 RepID=UPI0018D423DE|nr:hypothetical protein [Mycobacterium sp. 852002-51613_SCH5001154]